MNFLILDVGGQSIKYALMNERAEFIEKGKIPTPTDTIENFVDVVGNIFDEHKNIIQGMGVSMPGRIDSDRGYLYTGGALKYNDNTEMKDILEKRCPLPITIENDGKCAALAEAWIGNLRDCDDAMVIVIGTGIGGGVIKNKELHKGKHFIAGEFGFINMPSDNSGDKSAGMLSSQCGTPYLCKSVASAKNLPIEKVDGYKVFEYAKNGDTEVLNILDDYCHKMALQIYNLQHIYDPEKFAIGGGISKQNIFIEYLQNNIEKCASEIPYLIKPKILRCKFFNDSNLIGSLYNYLTKFHYPTII